MSVKVSIELSERQLALAEDQMRSSGYDSLTSYIAALIEEKATHLDRAGGARSEQPDDTWLNQGEFWKGYDESRESRTKK